MEPKFEELLIPHYRPGSTTGANHESPEAGTSTNQENATEARIAEPQKNTSEARIQANRENAKKSTGPKTPQGKRNSSRNAVKHGILAVEVVSEREDGAWFSRLVNQLCDDYSPEGTREYIQVERIAASLWRLSRALGYESRAVDESHDVDLNRTLRYESHVERTLERATKELERLQSARKARELKSLDPASTQADGDPVGESVPDPKIAKRSQ